MGEAKRRSEISLKTGRKLYRVGPAYETICAPGMTLQAEWEPTDDTFLKCRINGRFVTPIVYKQHRDRVNGRR